MLYTLMHRNIKVADIRFDEDVGEIDDILDIHCYDHLPFGLRYTDNKPSIVSLNKWLFERAVPSSRYGLSRALEYLKIKNISILSIKSMALSLSDQYWIRPSESDINWHNVNFFENTFSSDIGNILLGNKITNRKPDFNSPDSNSNGWLPKKWLIAGEKRILLKGGSSPFFQEPFNEVIAAEIMKRLNIPHVDYSLTFINDKPYSVCDCFVNKDTELISAFYVNQYIKNVNNTSNYEHYIKCCETTGILNAKENLDKMIALDYIIANTDRHYGNFGLLRNSKTLEWIGIAPLWDSGSSLYYNVSHEAINPDEGAHNSSFVENHNEQITLIKDFNWLHFKSLKGIDSLFEDILKRNPLINKERRKILSSTLIKRIENLEKIANVHHKQAKKYEKSS